MATITVPARFAFSNISTFQLGRLSNSLRSKYTAQRQLVTYPYAVWTLEGTLVETDGVDAGAIRAFLADLEGQANNFRLPVPGYSKPINPLLTSNGSCSSAAARAKQISVTGLNGPVTRGDFFTINDELKIATVDLPSNGALTFKPPLRKAVSGATPVIFQNPTVLMTSADDDIANWGLRAPVRQSTKVEFIEDISI